MSAASLTAEDIALFLTQHSEFFQDHAELFASLQVPHPHEKRTISLGERQIMTLRSRARELEWKLAGLVNNASGNEKISRVLNAWCCRMLAETDPTQLPAHIVRSLSELFELPTIALRLWDLPRLPECEFTRDVDNAIRQYAQKLTKPYCGPLQDQKVATWFESPPASLAIIALKTGHGEMPFGLLVLGSEEPDRFTADMGTLFLDTICQLCSASLSRLKETVPAAQRAGD